LPYFPEKNFDDGVIIRLLQRRGERRATINEEVGGVYDVNVL
jgi:hypothetical protein